MFKCPVCGHATLNLWQHTVSTSFGSVVCSNCNTRIHSPPKARYALVGLPFLFLIPANHLRLLDDARSAIFWIVSCAIVSFALGTWLKRLEPTDPTKRGNFPQ